MAVFVGYWAIAFNTFALQTMLTFSVLSIAIFSNWYMPAATLLSLALFLALHPSYGWSYIKHTFLFSKAYSADLAAIFILVRRYSIWRDFVWDFWKQFATNPLKKSLSYIYENSAIIVIFLNPFFLIGTIGFLFSETTGAPPLLAYSGMIITLALVVFIATSFRKTRFYGEPERYVEMASVFGNISGIYYTYIWFGLAPVMAILAYCFVAVMIQIFISKMLAGHLEGNISQYDKVIQVINDNFEQGAVRFAANNEEITKYVMTEDWNFVRYWSFGNPLAGFNVSETFYKYPFIRMPVFEEIIARYGVNVCVIDENLEGDFLSKNPEKKDRIHELYRHDNLAVYTIEKSGSED
ncbi:MAG: hypothetical protein GXP16_06980 [Gammaproteobacteria bacterium]|nr:hypothetical protein [Gammaproteobacteria bacterium]